MAGIAQYRDKAIELAKDAVNLDKAEKYEEALNKYKISLEYFVYVIKYETN